MFIGGPPYPPLVAASTIIFAVDAFTSLLRLHSALRLVLRFICRIRMVSMPSNPETCGLTLCRGQADETTQLASDEEVRALLEREDWPAR